MMSQAHPLFTGSASKFKVHHFSENKWYAALCFFCSFIF